MPNGSFQISLKRMITGVAIVSVLASFGLLPLRKSLREASCVANLRTIGLALQSYHSAYGCFPPAYTVDPAGKPVHSWRILILPYAGEDALALYKAYRFDEPWNGSNNSRLARKMPEFYGCLAHANPYCSNYAVVVGPETAFPGSRSSSLSQVKDGTAVLVVEVEGGVIPWMEPRDLEMPAVTEPDKGKLMAALRGTDTELLRQGLADRDFHTKGVNFLFTDQRVEPFQICDGALLRGLLTIDGGEVFCIEWY